MEYQERIHTQVRGFLHGGINDELLGVFIFIGIPQDGPYSNSSLCSANFNFFPSSCNQFSFVSYGIQHTSLQFSSPWFKMTFFLGHSTFFFTKIGKKPKHAYTYTNPLYNHINILHVFMVVQGGKKVDMPYGLWEDLHQLFVCAYNAHFLKTSHPMLHVFYKSMEVQLCVVTKCC